MLVGKICKQPIEKLDFDFDYRAFFSVRIAGDSIASKSTVIERTKTGSTNAASSLVVTSQVSVDSIIRVWISGGVTDEQYKVTLTVTSVQGRIITDELIVDIKKL